jgi:hypothetical protein
LAIKSISFCPENYSENKKLFKKISIKIKLIVVICNFIYKIINNMKKLVLKSMLLLALPLAFAFQGCKKDSKNTANIELGKATITGRVVGNLNANSGVNEPVEGIRVIARVNISDLIAQGTAPAGAIKVFETTTDATGNYTLEIEAGNKPMAITLQFPNGANLEQTKENGTKEVVNFTVNNPTRTFTMLKGETRTENATMSSVNETPLATITVRGKVEFRNDLCNSDPAAQLSNAPSTTKLYARWHSDNISDLSSTTDREILVNVKSDGTYEVKIETTKANRKIVIQGVKFAATQRYLDGSDCKTKNDHEYSHSVDDVTVGKSETAVLNVEFN